ncbi:phage portal protein [Christiangramia sp.]|uniref:phage portal protein n=1 Tax=Christiangramia sp. TaxID=1931228 RepID=UPI0026184E9C|nr:phage portal protein [Christiangramia sp.]
MQNFNLDPTNETEVKEFLNNKKKDLVDSYYKEYNGDRQIRSLQIGKRANYKQGNKTVEAEKLKINFQKKIVNTAVSFLFGEQPAITPKDSSDKGSVEILNILEENRIGSKLMDFSEAVMSSTIGAFIFNIDEDGNIKTRVYGSKNGTYTPFFDVYGDLKLFFWEFTVDDDTTYTWIFDDSNIYKYEDSKYVDIEEHGFDVIPVVFLEQDEPEWWEVKEMIDRVEMIISKLAGSNNYFAFPILKMLGAMEKDADGNEKTLIDIAEDGKALMMGYAIKEGQIIKGEADFLQRDTGVDSIKLEIEYLKEFIFNISQTPDLSFNNVKGIGAISGRALLLMLQDAINKSKRKQGHYKTVIERIISVIKSGLRNTNSKLNTEDAKFNIKFNLSLPKDLSEEVRTLVEATGGRPILSQEAGVKHSPYTEDVEKEMENLTNEEAQRNGRTFRINEDD